MANTIFEQTGGTYTMQGDYCLPNLTLPPEEERPIGVWAHCRRQYLKQHHKILYYNLLTSGGFPVFFDKLGNFIHGMIAPFAQIHAYFTP